MTTKHLNQTELSGRWNLSPRTLERWRWLKTGPAHLKIGGRVVYREHRPGLCLDARRTDCSEKNESMTWGFESPRVTIVARQITGAIARRIVPWANVGDELKKGDRFGMIRFGSRTELYLPVSAIVLVKIGDHVLGGSTIIARLAEAEIEQVKT